jgi:hypothetical protein
VLARVRIGDDDDDVEGHAISIHFPDADRARRFRNELLAAGILTATVAMGVGTGMALAPHQQAGSVGSTTQSTVFMDTSAQAREGGAISASRTLVVPVGSASDLATKAREAAASSGASALDTATKAREGGAAATTAPRHTPVGRHGAGVNAAAAAAATQTAAGLHGSLAGSSDATNPAAAAAAAETSAGLHGSLAGSASQADTSSKAVAGDSSSERNAQAAKTGSAQDEDPTPQSGFNP